MAPVDKDPKPQPPAREQRLAQALRANLRRRKTGEAAAGRKPGETKSGEGN